MSLTDHSLLLRADHDSAANLISVPQHCSWLPILSKDWAQCSGNGLACLHYGFYVATMISWGYIVATKEFDSHIVAINIVRRFCTVHRSITTRDTKVLWAQILLIPPAGPSYNMCALTCLETESNVALHMAALPLRHFIL